MATGNDRSDALSGRDLQESQATGLGEGEVTRGRTQGETGGAQIGGGPEASDMAAPGGSSGSGGSGGYGNAQNQANHQGQQTGPEGHVIGQSRGERFDEAQGGGRDADSVAPDEIAQQGGSAFAFDQRQDQNALDKAADDLIGDQQAHQDRGQGSVEFDRDADS